MRRMNFFDGFLASTDDWLAGQNYHLEKRRLHNRLVHGIGVLPVGGRLRVRARKQGDLSMEIDSGVALDGEGNELVLSEPVIKRLRLDDFPLPCTLYVQLEYRERPTDWIEYPEHPSYKGHRSVEEGCEVVLSPSLGRGVELARIRLTPQLRSLYDAANLLHPAEGEIDLRFVPLLSGASQFPGQVSHSWRSSLELLRSFLLQLAALELNSSKDLLLVIDIFLMFQASQLVNQDNLASLLNPLLEREAKVGEELEAAHSEVRRFRRFSDYRRTIEASRRLLRARLSTPTGNEVQGSNELLSLRLKANEALRDSLDDLLSLNFGPQQEQTSWESLNLRSSDFPELLEVDGQSLRLISVLKPADEDSSRRHQLLVEGQKDSWKSRQTFAYPNQVEVMDAGLSFVGGQIRFRVEGLNPGKDLVLVKRYDALYGEQNCEILVEGRRAGLWKVASSDRRFRWRNHHFRIPGSFVTGTGVEIVKKAVSVKRDVNVFRLWFYQST